MTVTIGTTTYVEGIVNGKANFIIPDLPVNEYNVDIKYNGDGKYFTNETTAKLSVAQSAEYSVDVVDNGNGTLTITVSGNAGGNVTVNINGTNYTANVTNGKAVVNISDAAPGSYNTTVYYSGDGTLYTVKVIGDDGNPVGAGEYIAIKVNGVVYAAKTNDKGYASLQLKLNPKSYTVTAEYKNSKVSNKLSETDFKTG